MNKIIEIDDKDKGRVAKDGETFRFRMPLMDGAPPELKIAMQLADSVRRNEQFDAAAHRPGFVRLTDQQQSEADKAHLAYEKRLTDAWRNPPSLDATQLPDTAASPAPTTDRDAARLQHERWLRDAWKTGGAR